MIVKVSSFSASSFSLAAVVVVNTALVAAAALIVAAAVTPRLPVAFTVIVSAFAALIVPSNSVSSALSASLPLATFKVTAEALFAVIALEEFAYSSTLRVSSAVSLAVTPKSFVLTFLSVISPASAVKLTVVAPLLSVLIAPPLVPVAESLPLIVKSAPAALTYLRVFAKFVASIVDTSDVLDTEKITSLVKLALTARVSNPLILN